MVFRIIWRKFRCTFKPLARFVAAANAHGPARRIAIQQSEGALRPGVIKMLVKSRRRFEFAFNFPDNFQCAERFRAGKLAEIHRQIIMSRRGFRLAHDKLATGGDALPGNDDAFSVVRGEVCEVKTRAGKFPCSG